MTQTGLPGPMVEAARDLLVIYGTLNLLTPATHLLRPLGHTKADQVSLAYSAVAQALELAAACSAMPTATVWSRSWGRWRP